MANRLNLDFKLKDAEERLRFLDAYLDISLQGHDENPYVSKYNSQRYPFPFPHEPTAAELEMMGNYVLWGHTTPSPDFPNIKEDQSVVDAKYVEIPVRNSPWSRKEEDSLHAMMEESNESGKPVEVQNSLLSDLHGRKAVEAIYRFPKETFSRAQTRRQLRDNPRLLMEYERLWRQIDETDYTITTYQIRAGKRDKPIRDELEERLTNEQKDRAIERADTLTLHTWGKLRRELVDLRRQQYYLKDGFAPTIGRPRLKYYTDRSTINPLEFKDVAPCGVLNAASKFGNLLFYDRISEEHFSSFFQGRLRDYLLNYEESALEYALDFRDLDHVSLFLYALKDLQPDEEMEYSQREYIEQTIDTYFYYVRTANLDVMHRDILFMKSRGYTNDQIASYVNPTYGKTYSPNYISTIFRAKCCKAINDAASMHITTLRHLLEGKDNFKECNSCGRLLLRSPDNFVRKARARDGLTNRCKECDKAARQRAN